MNLSVTPVNTNVNFQGQAINRGKYFDIKNIKNVPCACCGKKMILPEQIRNIYKTISRPLGSIMKLGLLDNWKKHKNIWSSLEKMAAQHPKDSFDNVLEKDDNYRILLGIMKKLAATIDPKEKDSLSKKLMASAMYNSREKLRGSGVVMKKLAPLKSYLDGQKLETFEQLEIYSRKYPRKTLSEIINMDEIVNFHQTKDLLQRAETKEKIDYHFENIQKIIQKSVPKSQEYFDELKDKALDILAYTDDPQVRVINIKKLYQQMLAENNCEKLKNKVNKEIDQMPKTYITKDSFLFYAHNHNYNDAQILSAILGPATSTFEHVVPKSELGADRMGNGLVMHASCNSARSSMPYMEYFEYHPEMPKNIQRQVNFIAKFILDNSLDGEFRFWPMAIANTLNKYTNGAIKLNLSNYCEKGLKQTHQRRGERQAAIEKHRIDYNSKLSQKQELLRQLDNLDKEANGLNRTIGNLIQENKEEKPLINSYKSHLRKNRTDSTQE